MPPTSLKISIVLNLLAPTEEDIFLIFAFFVDAPCTTAREWCYIAVVAR
jgi:hypothetical protein